MEILIRPWRKDDFPAVRRILWESWRAAYRAFIPEEDLRAYFEATYRIDSLDRLHASPHIDGFIGEADGEAAGWARTQFHKDENRLYLASLYLLPAFQGKGIGGSLLGAAQGKALACGLTEIWVGVMVQNEAARGFYERRGFRFVQEEPFQMGRTTVPHLIGVKTITNPRRDEALQRTISAVYPGEGDPLPLAGMADRLLDGQKKTWPGLADGYASLEAARTREITGGKWRMKVQFNPRRIVSSGAPVDPESVRRRPCFLCVENLPPGQRAILYRETYLVLCNPFPILPGHLTITHLRHVPQSISGNRETFLRLAADFGPGMTVFYNGPRSGASAPDHLHFQAAPAGLLPVEEEILLPANRTRVGERGGTVLWRAVGLGRGIIVIEGEDAGRVAAALGEVVVALGRSAPFEGEPLMNLFCTYAGKGWRLMIFPRRKHRPEAYFREGEGRLLVSPGAVDMGGIIVTPREEDYQAMNPALVQEIFREVAYDDAAVETLLALL
ncbi:MAG: GNAT family N-acetyltransferase [Syntrophales bacterium]